MPHRYVVEIVADPEVPEEHRARFKVCLERRLAKLAERGKVPEAGQTADILDNFAGKYVWEMTPAELEQTPPSSVELEIRSLEPLADGSHRVVAAVVY